MTREQGPKFSEKHEAGAQIDPAMKKNIKDKAKNNEISCAVAFQLSEELATTPADVGKGIDLLDTRLIKCQLGLFGYGPGKKAVKPKLPQSRELEDAICKALVEKRLSCHAAWQIAQRFNIPKMTVSAACEALGIKIKPCQLGAF
jgi:hypothetical protein